MSAPYTTSTHKISMPCRNQGKRMSEHSAAAEDQLAVILAAQREKQNAQVRTQDRSSFIPRSDSPGPAAYTQDPVAVKPAAPRTVFGSSNRDKEAIRYISALHNATMPPSDTPGPGTYRVMLADKSPHSPKCSPSPTWKFGTAAQRPDEPALVGSRSPGPIYMRSSWPEAKAPSYSFAPMGNLEMGMYRSRDDNAGVYISPLHSQMDRSARPDADSGVGPGHYNIPGSDVLSTYGKVKDIKFATASRDAKNSYTALQLAADPLATSAAHAPPAHYDVPTPSGGHSTKFGTGPRSYSPDKGPGPYISRLHEASQQGMQSPGPGTYTIVTSNPRSKAVGGWLGDAPTFSFGTGPQSVPQRASLGPGPGAYVPRQNPSSRAHTAPSYTLGPALRVDMASVDRDPAVPGPGTYNVAQASERDARRHKPAAFTMGGTGGLGRSSFVSPTIGPGPCYMLPGVIDDTPGKGFSFGVKEKTVSPKSTVSVRYHGPLAAQEALGTQSPGPGLYDTSAASGRLSPTKRTPDIKFGLASRQGPRTYISKLHAEAEGQGLDSPGPGAYDHGSVELAVVTSRYRKAPCAAFSVSPRFKMTYMTF